jgi:hypothetical protein
MNEKPQLFWGLIASMWVGNLMLVVLNLPLIGMWIKLLTVPYRYLYPVDPGVHGDRRVQPVEQPVRRADQVQILLRRRATATRSLCVIARRMRKPAHE